MQVAANAIVDIIAPAPNAAAAKTTALAGMNFGRVLQSILQADQETSLDALLGGPDASAAAAPAMPLAFNLPAPPQTPAIPAQPKSQVAGASIETFGRRLAEAAHGLSERAADSPPGAPISPAGERGASPPSFSLPQQAASPLHAPEWTPPGSFSVANDAAANTEPDANIPQSKIVGLTANSQLVAARARPEPMTQASHLEANAPSAPSHVEQIVRAAPADLASMTPATATIGADLQTPMAPGVVKAVAAVQSPPAQAPQDGVEVPVSSALSTMITAAPASFGATPTRETPAPAQPPMETAPATLIPDRSAEPVTTRKAQPDAPHGRDAASIAQKETPSPKAPNVVLSPAAQAVAKEPAPPTFITDPSAQIQLASAATGASHAALGAAVHDHAARAAPAAAQVAREIVRRFDGETTRFELRLDPPELGRVEVRLEVTRDHRVSAVVAADTPQALSELARHARDLEQTLQSAGLQLNENGLSFDLRQSDAGAAEAGLSGAAGPGEARDDEPPAQILARPIGLERWRGVRLDLMV